MRSEYLEILHFTKPRSATPPMDGKSHMQTNKGRQSTLTTSLHEGGDVGVGQGELIVVENSITTLQGLVCFYIPVSDEFPITGVIHSRGCRPLDSGS